MRILCILIMGSIENLPSVEFMRWKVAKPIPRNFEGEREEETFRDYPNILKGCSGGFLLGGGDGVEPGDACYEKIKPIRQNGIGLKI